MILNEFDIEYVDRNSIKGQNIADQLVEAPIKDDHPLIADFLDENTLLSKQSNRWTLYFDGSQT